MAFQLNGKVIKAVLIDLSGTLHIEDKVTSGAVEALERLRSTGLHLKFLTNTTKESKSYLYNRLANCGFLVKKDEIFSSLIAARQYIQEKQVTNPLFLLEEEAFEDFNGINSTDTLAHDAVVIGLAPSQFQYDSLNKAFRCLMNGASLIAIHKGRYYSRGDGLALGPGPFVAGLEYATGKKATIVGKPEKRFFLSALEGLNCKPEEVVMIGDDVLDDVEGALLAGLQAILVRTGKYRQDDESRSSLAPTLICDNFSEAVVRIIGG